MKSRTAFFLGISLSAAVAFAAYPSAKSTPTKETPPFPTIHMSGVSDTEIEVAKKAIRIFLDDACPNLVKYQADIERVDASVYMGHGPDYSYRYDLFGWTNSVTMRVKIKEHTTLVPKHLRAFGHTLTFDMGAGNLPGVTSGKEQGYGLCDMMSNGGRLAFPGEFGSHLIMPVPGMAFLDNIPHPDQTAKPPVKDPLTTP